MVTRHLPALSIEHFKSSSQTSAYTESTAWCGIPIPTNPAMEHSDGRLMSVGRCQALRLLPNPDDRSKPRLRHFRPRVWRSHLSSLFVEDNEESLVDGPKPHINGEDSHDDSSERRRGRKKTSRSRASRVSAAPVQANTRRGTSPSRMRCYVLPKCDTFDAHVLR
jgi:hypothetical protein